MLTSANAPGHDAYYKLIDPIVPTVSRVTVSKILLLVAPLAAYVTAQKPADILFLVSAAFSFATASFFSALSLGISWKCATGTAAALGMVAGLGVFLLFADDTARFEIAFQRITLLVRLWYGIEPISAGIFGVPVGFPVIFLVSLVTWSPT